MPARATESDILAWIEGELPSDRIGAVEAAFADDPSLRVWATSLREDRAALMAWSRRAVESSPRGLAESAIERVEREALLGPSESEALLLEAESAAPAPGWKIRRYASAAAILLLVGVISITGVRLGTDSGWFGNAQKMLVEKPAEREPLIEHDAEPSDPHDDLIDAVAGGAAPQVMMESTDSEATPMPADTLELASAQPVQRDFAYSEADGAARQEVGIVPLARSMAYSELVQRLLGDNVIGGGPSIPVSSEVASRPDVRDRVVVRAWSADPAAVAEAMGQLASDKGSPAVGWRPVLGEPGEPSPVAGVVCTVSLPGEAAGFDWFVDALLKAGASRVELTLRDGALPVDSATLDAAGALWWGEPIRRWAGWVRTPVLIAPQD